MSYILDALRRAEAERGRGGVPGLHTQAAPTGGLSAPSDRGTPVPLWLVVAGAAGVAAVAAAGTWWALRPAAPTPGAALPTVATAPAAPPPVPASAPAAAAPVTPPPVAPVSAPAPAAVPAPAPASARAPEPRAAARGGESRNSPPPRERERERATPPATAPAPSRSATAEPTRPRGAAAAPAPAPAPAPAANRVAPEPAAQPPAGAPVFTQAELPEALRTQLPTLKVTGATYSSNPAYRMAIVNGQVLHEGDAAAPGLVLERIEPGRTVWAFRGYRYAVPAQ